MADDLMDPNPYTDKLPTQLRAWDSTSLRSYMTCPRRYQYEIVEGWRRASGNLHTFWGGTYHAAVEEFDKARARGLSKEDALDMAFDFALRQSGEYVATAGEIEADPATQGTWVPWDAEYLDVWQCTDPGPAFKSGPRKGEPNPAKRCEFAKREQTGYAPDECPACARPVTSGRRWVYGDDIKNRHTLLRAVVWYADEQPEEGGVQAYVFPDGRPAVELSFQLPLPITTPDGEPYLLCGHMDGIATFGDEVAVRERKTTKSTLGGYFFDKFAPDVQVDLYDLAAGAMFPELGIKAVMLEATQTAAGFARFQRQFFHSTEGRRAEFFNDLLHWIKRAEADAWARYYPKNEAACNLNGGCPFRDICRLDPSKREMFLRANFVRQKWNPLKER